MKRIILSAAILVSFAASAQSNETTITRFQEVKAKMEYSSKYCTPVMFESLQYAQTSNEKISSVWLYGAMSSNKQLRTKEVFKFYASISNYTQVSALINQYKEFQNDFCYTVYLSMNPDQIDLQWLKLQVKDTALSYLFAAR